MENKQYFDVGEPSSASSPGAVAQGDMGQKQYFEDPATSVKGPDTSLQNDSQNLEFLGMDTGIEMSPELTNYLAGMGKSFSDFGTGLKQHYLAVKDALHHKTLSELIDPNSSELAQYQNKINDEAELMRNHPMSGWGTAGNLIGNGLIASAVNPTGVAGNAAVGGLMGALGPQEGRAQDIWSNTATSAGIGMGFGALGATVGKLPGALMRPFDNAIAGGEGQQYLNIFKKFGLDKILDTAQRTEDSGAANLKGMSSLVSGKGEEFYRNLQAPEITKKLLMEFGGMDDVNVIKNLAKANGGVIPNTLDRATPEVLEAIKNGTNETIHDVLKANPLHLNDPVNVDLHEINPDKFPRQSTNSTRVNLGQQFPNNINAQHAQPVYGQSMRLTDILDQIKEGFTHNYGGDSSHNPVIQEILKLQHAALQNDGVIPAGALSWTRTAVSDLYDHGALTAKYGGILRNVLDSALAQQETVPGDVLRFLKASQVQSNLHWLQSAVAGVRDSAGNPENVLDLRNLYKSMEGKANLDNTTTGWRSKATRDLYDLARAGQYFFGGGKQPFVRQIAQGVGKGLVGGLAGYGLGKMYGAEDPWKYAAALGAGNVAGGLANSALFGGALRNYAIKSAESPVTKAIAQKYLPFAGARLGNYLQDGFNAPSSNLLANGINGNNQ